VAKSWSSGRDASIADYRTEKDVRPTRLLVNTGDPATVHYLFPLADGCCLQLDILATAARCITHLGWGVDMVAANASIISEEEVANLPGVRWRPTEGSSAEVYRVPIEGTLDALIDRHTAFLNRIGPDGFNPVPPLSTFRVVGYRRTTDPAQRQFAGFSILKPDASGFRSFETTRRTRDVAGMVRGRVAHLARNMRPFGWTDEDINVGIHGKTRDGHGPVRGEESPDRFLYLPMPTINSTLHRVESIRRVLIAAPPHWEEQISWISRALSGEELTNDEGEVMGLATLLPRSDWVFRQYVGESRSWSTVTPVILPGHDDRNFDKAEKLFRTAFEQAGYERELVSQIELEWRGVGFRAGVDMASRYLPPENLNHKPRYHVRVRFPKAIRGPVAVGGGRFRGFGLFAIDD